jgi:DNA-binding FrmR family transcriptional regulator
MDEQGQVKLAERLARAEGELRAAQRALDGSSEARMRYARASREHAAATWVAEEVFRCTTAGGYAQAHEQARVDSWSRF